jgi:hypothetical protein
LCLGEAAEGDLVFAVSPAVSVATGVPVAVALAVAIGVVLVVIGRAMVTTIARALRVGVAWRTHVLVVVIATAPTGT